MTNLCRAGRPFNSYQRRNQLLLALLLTMTALAVAHRTFADVATSVEFDIPAQSVPEALGELARQAQVQLFFISDGFENIQANAVAGNYSIQQALDLLLAGTGLAANYSSESGVKVTPASGSVNSLTLGSKLVAVAGAAASTDTTGRYASEGGDADAWPAAPDGMADDYNDEQSDKVLEEIVITGSSIRGIVPESSPLEIYDAVDIRNTGALTIEQFVSTLPQNNNTLSEMGTGNSSRVSNPNASNSVDLRGLGVGSTLVLINGRRMAPSSSGRSADLSFIPIGVVERVEVLTDGASAIYGADAIGGVINFALRDQQEGAETILTYGGADGGNEQLRIDQSFGINWTDGNALIALSYFDRNALDAGDRDFSQTAAPFTLVPKDTRKNLLATISQLGPGDLRVSADLLYSAREPRSVQTQFLFGGDFSARKAEHQQTLLNLEVKRPFGAKVNGEFLVTYADASTDAAGFLDGTILGVGPFLEREDTRSVDITTKLDGELAKFRSGAVMFALGAGYSEDEYRELSDFSAAKGSAPSDTSLDRDTTYAFAELLLPIFSPKQNVSGIWRLELSLATRYTDYSDFGDDTSPKIGVLWSPVELLKIRGTLGESFKAPFLFQKNPSGGQNAFFPQAALGFPDIWTPDDSAIVLFAQGPGNPALQAESAKTVTFGLDLDFSRVTITATYFDIEYTDRIAEPDSTGGFAALGNPQGFPDLFNLNPGLEEIMALLSSTENFLNLTGIDINDVAAVHAATTVFFDNRIQNLSISEMSGLDLGADYTTKASAGELSFGVRASKIFNFEERISPNAAPVSLVDTVLFPADLKARAYVGFQNDRWNARLNVNYVDDYDNPFDVANPTVDDWTTVDLVLSYEFRTDKNRLMDGVRLGFTIQNVIDEDPPFLPVSPTTNTGILNPTGFDPANANPIGRFIDLQISKRW